MNENLLVLHALGVNRWAAEEYGDGLAIWQETVRRARLCPGVDLVVVREANEDILPVTGVDEIRVAGGGVWQVFSALREKHPGYRQYAFADLYAPFLDPELVASFIAAGERQIAQYTYGEHYPRGTAPEVLSSEALEILTGIASGNNRPFNDEAIFDLMGLDINAYDIEMVVSEIDFRRWRLDLRARSRHAWTQIRAIRDILPDPARTGYGAFAAALAGQPGILRTLPVYVEIDLVDACQLACRFCPRQVPGAEASGGGGAVLDPEAAFRIIDQLAALNEDATVALSPSSEPLLAPKFREIAGHVLARNLRLVVETNGLALDGETAVFLAGLPDERSIVIISLDFADPARYAEAKGGNVLGIAAANARALFALRRRNVWLQAIQFSGGGEDLDAFYREWKDFEEAILPRKFNNWCGLIPGETAVDLSPLVRTPCWHLARDLVIRADGRVTLCKQDLSGAAFTGNVLEEGLEAVWLRLGAAWTEHLRGGDGRGAGLCARCDEWHTFNF